MQAVSEVLADAFAPDPVWGWAFPGRAQQQVWWRFWVTGAMPQGWVRVARSPGVDGIGAAAVWIPPGGHECAAEDEAHVEPLLRALVGDRAALVDETLRRFDENHPRDVPHYYLSLLGTATARRGQGIGMALLAENLDRIDEESGAAYLESSNPANLDRYRSVGFEPHGQFPLPEGDVVVTTMWHDPR